MRIIDDGSFTDAGGRALNEDALLRLPELPLYAVADGMGGDGAGDAAARIAIGQLMQEAPRLADLFALVSEDRTSTSRLRMVQAFDALFNDAGRTVHRAAGERSSVGMATTLLIAAVVGQTAYVAHVGDSRAYLMREGRLLRLTEDHSVAELRFRRGRMSREEYTASPERQVLYQAVGSGPEVDVDLAEVRLADDDVLLLCTDGLIRATDEAAVSTALQSADLQRSLERLLAGVLRSEPPDNLTAIALRFRAEPGDDPIERITDAMATCFLFAGLTPPERLVVAPYVEDATFGAGEAVTEPGQNAEDLCLIAQGRVHEEGLAGGRDLGPGDTFGARALAREGVWRRRRVAVEDTRVLWFSRERFQELVRYKPDLGGRMALALSEHLGGQLHDAEDRIERVARVLG